VASADQISVIEEFWTEHAAHKQAKRRQITQVPQPWLIKSCKEDSERITDTVMAFGHTTNSSFQSETRFKGFKFLTPNQHVEVSSSHKNALHLDASISTNWTCALSSSYRMMIWLAYVIVDAAWSPKITFTSVDKLIFGSAFVSESTADLVLQNQLRQFPWHKKQLRHGWIACL